MRTAIATMFVIAAMSCGKPPTTVADYCDGVGVEYCSRSIECNGSDALPQSECQTIFTRACCDGIDCSKALTSAQVQQAYDCEDGYRASSCASIRASLIPAGCVAK